MDLGEGVVEVVLEEVVEEEDEEEWEADANALNVPLEEEACW